MLTVLQMGRVAGISEFQVNDGWLSGKQTIHQTANEWVLKGNLFNFQLFPPKIILEKYYNWYFSHQLCQVDDQIIFVLKLVIHPAREARGPEVPARWERLGCFWQTVPPQWEGGGLFHGSTKFFTETAVTPERKVEKSFPRSEINRHAEG